MAVSALFPAAIQPLIGALLGLCGGVCILMLPKGPGAVAALALWTAATLASGERGITRWFTKLPLFGSLLAGITILVRWYALISLHSPTKRMLLAVAGSMAIARSAMVAVAWVSRPADDQAVGRLKALTTTATLIAMAQGAALALVFPMSAAVALALAAYLVVRLVSWFTAWRYGGIRVQDLEANRVLAETLCLALLASIPPVT